MAFLFLQRKVDIALRSHPDDRHNNVQGVQTKPTKTTTHIQITNTLNQHL